MKTSPDISLVSLRNDRAPLEKSLGGISLPQSLLLIASQIIQTGKKVEILDRNFPEDQFKTPSAEQVGTSLLGAPYIPESQKFINSLEDNQKVILGGQIINTLNQNEFSQIFKNPQIIRGNTQLVLEEFLSLHSENLSIKPKEQISLIPAYEQIPDSMWKEYLHPSREISLYLSQGCAFNCSFCTAEKGKPESYRNLNLVKNDLEWLVEKSTSLGYKHLNIYVSNLDVLQTPEKLYSFCQKVEDLQEKYKDFSFNIRGLATIDSADKIFHNPEETIHNTSLKKYELITKLQKIGFSSFGYGVDGIGKEVWKATHKPNNIKKIIRVMEKTRDYGFTPETLMVFGHGADTEQTMKDAVETSQRFYSEYGAIPRPHSAKDIPGNEGWKTLFSKEYLLQNPQFFQNLDFTAEPSVLTHQDETRRELSRKFYLEMCSSEGSTTLPIRPYEPHMSESEMEEVRKQNEGKYDH